MEEKGGEEYVAVKVADIGYTDEYGLEGFLVLVDRRGRRFPIRAFSGEVARHIARFKSGDRSSIPTIYNLVEEMADMHSLFLTSVEIYQSGEALRANLIFQGRDKMHVFKHYRASDSIALAVFYDARIMLDKKLLDLDGEEEGELREGEGEGG